MDPASHEIVDAERQADPELFGKDAASTQRQPHQARPEATRRGTNAIEPAEPVYSDDSSISSVEPTATRQATNTTAIEMDFMHYLERHPTARKRMQEHRLQHSQTVGSSKRPPASVEGVVLPPFGGNKPYPPLLPAQEEYVVEFDGPDDPKHAMNWPFKKKIAVVFVMGFFTLGTSFASSVFSAATKEIEEKFHKGQEVVTLGTSLFVLGYVFGPIIFAPMSELYGRRLPVLIAAMAFGIFNIGVAVAKDYQTIMICRFFAGFAGSCPQVLTGAIMADMFADETRGAAVASFCSVTISGPMIGPPIGGFIAKSYLGWRWTAYIPAFMGFTSFIAAFIWQKESYGPTILVEKAAELRRLTHNWGIHAKQEEVELDIHELVTKNISRPLQLLFTEPIVFLVTVYASFIYGLLYLTITAYNIVFGRIYGWSQGVSGLPFFGMIVGVGIALIFILVDVPAYRRKLRANNGIVVPEWRLPLTMLAGIVFTIGLFWFGWTGFTSNIPWIVPTLSGIFLGFGIFAIFLQCFNYLLDAYVTFAASVLAANTILRSAFAAVFPLFGTYMYDGIGIQWGQTFLGCVAALFIPMPFVFYFYGKRIRKRSKYSSSRDLDVEEKKDVEAAPDTAATRTTTDDSRETKETKEE